MALDPAETNRQVAEAVARFWQTREAQRTKQRESGKVDQGLRGAVTGRGQMDGFADMLATLVSSWGIPADCIHRKKAIELPGFFRPTKQWDFLVVVDHTLIAAIELKSQVGPSFSNNFNNRIEEAIGSAKDLWTAYREGAFGTSPTPFLGYVFLLEDCPEVRKPVRVEEPHFRVFPEFTQSSYLQRYEVFCRKLVRERLYTAATLITTPRIDGLHGSHGSPSDDLAFHPFVKALVSHVSRFV